jgi:hypothetical protein
MAPSQLSSSLSQARSYSYSLVATTCEGDEVVHQSTSKSWRHDKEASPGEHRHGVKTNRASGDAQLEEAFILAQWDGNWQ